MSKIRVLLADDHQMFRQGIRTILSFESDLEVVAEACNATEAVEQTTELRPDIVLMDIGMTGLCSFEAIRAIKRNRPEVKIMMLTMHSDEEFLVRGMEVGATGYVLKESAASELVAAIREVWLGGHYLSPRMLNQLVEDFRTRLQSNGRNSRISMLTPREREVMKLLAEGNSVKEIAGDLGLSVKTVEAHKFNLMRKLDIHNKAQLVQYAIQKRIITVPHLV
ncbi:MAG TPA: response regulator transcription factor [Bryobacteraceae bacterium]|nr:response regulator transcription factor [Bryobacteraceae bacterium]